MAALSRRLIVLASGKPYAGKAMTMSYYQVPANVLEDGEELARWADASVHVAASAAPRKTRR